MQADTILLFFIIIGLGGIIYFLNKKLNELKPKEDTTTIEWLKSMEHRIDETSKTLNKSLSDSSKTINDSLFKQTQQMLNAQREIYSKLNESAKSIGEMSEVGKSLKDIQQFLASPKLRGGLGEQGLRQLLEQSLPKQAFHLQYTFRTGAKVDAAIKTNNGIVPIDSKFTMENFKKMMSTEIEKEREVYKKLFVNDVKDHIDSIAKKYILADEGTIDFALMYVPNEAVYYEIVNNDADLMTYAYKKRVMPVSPSTFYAFLRSVLLSFEGQKIASEIKNIQQALRSIQTETSKFGELLSTLQTHVTNAYSMMNRVATQFVGLSAKVENVHNVGIPDLEEKVIEEIGTGGDIN